MPARTPEEAARFNQYMRERRATAKAGGRCQECLAPLDGHSRVRCDRCRERSNAAARQNGPGLRARESSKDKARRKSREWRQDAQNREKAAEWKRLWRKKNKERARELSRLWYQANRERAISMAQARRVANPERSKALMARWRDRQIKEEQWALLESKKV